MCLPLQHRRGHMAGSLPWVCAGSGEVRSSLGSCTGTPSNISAEETPKSSLGAACQPKSAHVIWLCHAMPAKNASQVSLIFLCTFSDHAIGLWMVGCGENVLHPQLITQTGSHGRCELSPTVWHHPGQHAETWHPSRHEMFLTGRMLHILERDNFHPPCWPVDNG